MEGVCLNPLEQLSPTVTPCTFSLSTEAPISLLLHLETRSTLLEMGGKQASTAGLETDTGAREMLTASELRDKEEDKEADGRSRKSDTDSFPRA